MWRNGRRYGLKIRIAPTATPYRIKHLQQPRKNSASYLAQMAVKYPDWEKLAKLWPKLKPDVRKMIVGVAVINEKRK